VVIKNKPLPIDWELFLPIGARSPAQGTGSFMSLALIDSMDKAHTHRRRDDFESLFSLMIYWLNGRTHPFGNLLDKKEAFLGNWRSGFVFSLFFSLLPPITKKRKSF